MTEFLFVRHGEPDYSSPFTRCLQGACIMSRQLDLAVHVEHDLHEWELDTSHSVHTSLGIKRLLSSFHHGKWNPHSKWEKPEHTKERVLKVLDQYLSYDKVIVSTHAMVIIYTLGITDPPAYGEIFRIRYDGTHLEQLR